MSAPAAPQRPARGPSSGRWVLLRRLGILLAFVAVLARPGYGEVQVPQQVADLEVLVVVDRTRSMAALDHDGQRPRIDGARDDLAALVDELGPARYGLLTYGFDVQLELPFTEDTGALASAMETLRLETPTGGIGSTLQRPREEMLAVLGDAEEQYPERRRLVVFVSDGEQTTDAVGGSMTEVGDLVDDGAVWGYGTTTGARMPAEPRDPEAFVQDPATGRDAVSRADPQALQQLADQLGVDYVARTTGGGGEGSGEGSGDGSGGEGAGSASPAAIAELAEQWREDATTRARDTGERAAHDLTWLAALVLLALLLLELVAGWRALWTSRQVLTPGRPGGGR